MSERIFIPIRLAGFQKFDTAEGAQQWVEDTVVPQCMAGFAIAEVVLVHEAVYHWVDPRQSDDDDDAAFTQLLLDAGAIEREEEEERKAAERFATEVKGYSDEEDAP